MLPPSLAHSRLWRRQTWFGNEWILGSHPTVEWMQYTQNDIQEDIQKRHAHTERYTERHACIYQKRLAERNTLKKEEEWMNEWMRERKAYGTAWRKNHVHKDGHISSVQSIKQCYFQKGIHTPTRAGRIDTHAENQKRTERHARIQSEINPFNKYPARLDAINQYLAAMTKDLFKNYNVYFSIVTGWLSGLPSGWMLFGGWVFVCTRFAWTVRIVHFCIVVLFCRRDDRNELDTICNVWENLNSWEQRQVVAYGQQTNQFPLFL